MPEPRVEFDGVWKRFRRGVRHDSLRDLLPALVRSRFDRRRQSADELGPDEFWALRDVTFRVEPGRAFGIIGPNGAGKSTILKLLTGILRPNRGRALVRGRVRALIELAAGFHPDLSGRENVYLQGAIIGMKRAEIAHSFDRIVEFAELSEFIDTQVKRYSSGMKARLGFAIASHLDPEVLIIDEVLAVGDRAFQHKAFQRLEEIAKRDIPVVIASHQLDRVAALCAHAILIEHGRVARAGTAAECIAQYVSEGVEAQAPGSGALRLERLEVEPDLPVAPGGGVRVRIEAVAAGPLPEAHTLVVRVRRVASAEPLFSIRSRRAAVKLPDAGRFELRLALAAHLAGGTYLVEACVSDTERQRDVSPALHGTFRVRDEHDFRGLVDLEPRFEPPTRLGGDA